MKTKSFRRIAALTIAFSLIGGVTLAMPAMAAESTTRYIAVSATGTTLVVPDAVRIDATVSVLAKTTKEALDASSTSASAVRRALTAAKIATKDLATTSATVYPEYSYPQDGSAPVLSGYRASQSFSITVRQASTAGAVINAIVDAGGNNLLLNGVSPFVINDDKAIDVARGLAVGRAKAKANSYAKLLGVKLGKMIFLEETSAPVYYPVYSVSGKGEDSATQIDLGQQKISVSVSVHWAIG
ncbi:MAG: DUF541 domain-containing protein [Actinomycetales bacterium]|nr:MAG: DUF541 domain-containing protein [Actinomycetales bacterium]